MSSLIGQMFFKKRRLAKIKTSGLCEYEQLPVLELDGKKYLESHAINLYLAQVFNLMRKDTEENYQITNVFMAFKDFIKPIWETGAIQMKPKKQYFLNFPIIREIIC
jgi:hypothetical protein